MDFILKSHYLDVITNETRCVLQQITIESCRFQSKIIRVLNLWQKNQVFAADVIQPLFDLADPNHPIHKELSSAMTAQNNGLSNSNISATNLVKGVY